MLSIKFRNKKISLKTKIEIVNSIFDFIDVFNTKEVYYSEYTFVKVEESEVINWIDDLLENDILENLSNNYFITMVAEAPYGIIRAEISPQKARKGIPNCSHIDINLESDYDFYEILYDKNKISTLTNFFDRKQDLISEFYFFDLSASPDCYTDIQNRKLTKFYDEVDFANLLLQENKYNSKVEEKTTKAIGYNFTEQIFQEEHQPVIQSLIKSNNFDVACASGSFMIYGEDTSEFLNLIRGMLNEYITRINERNVYRTEFNKLFD
ncbi:hypothetical protein [Methanohalophilus euhalobius]|jgi:hypothetical protein|uniref:Uncharacterized protein n=1 Tax=Methanohalophilus euhalobius TaxID=51203 RepID=A0A314ZUQ9_9EURY|nr:hypothetical protein [Methanohalophilus euhalobius]PQV41787.1 hypothetical protein B0H22_1195 [Methanohalophilus euhalobius]RNI11382.1 hypothetical protein EDD83_02920 [Methanohalophilus euhalobius]